MVKIRNGNANFKLMLLLIGTNSNPSAVEGVVSKSSKHLNSQHNKPIWKDLQSGGVHNTARQFY